MIAFDWSEDWDVSIVVGDRREVLEAADPWRALADAVRWRARAPRPAAAGAARGVRELDGVERKTPVAPSGTGGAGGTEPRD